MEPLEYGKYYHIYNRGINGESIFLTKDNYQHFLKLYDKYIEPIAEIYAWCLMKNHFHFLVRIKEEEKISIEVKNPERLISQKFSNLFNAYSKAFNKRENRHGTLFERPFRRKNVTNDDYFRKLIIYIHMNPVHHNFVEQCFDYPWSSYLSIISNKPSRLKRGDVLGYFDDKANFIIVHQQKNDNFNLEFDW
jgi:REP element-mobilizing transposase RayT